MKEMSFSIQPLANKENLPKAIDFIINHFNEENKKIYFRGVTKDVMEILKNRYPDKILNI